MARKLSGNEGALAMKVSTMRLLRGTGLTSPVVAPLEPPGCSGATIAPQVESSRMVTVVEGFPWEGSGARPYVLIRRLWFSLTWARALDG